MHKARERDHRVEDCPRCGAYRGERCKNYKGKPKQPCRMPVPKRRPPYKVPADDEWVQPDIFN